MNPKTGLMGLLLASLVAVSGCNSTKFTTDNLPETQLYFGNGGGFSGLVNQYLLLENGQLFEKKGGAEHFSELKKARKKQATAIFSQLETISFSKLEIDQPGNTYRFVHLLAPSIDHKVTWGKPDYQVHAQVDNLYNDLMALVKKED